MSQLNDEILRATGAATINDGLSTWFSRTASESLNDAESRWLLSQVAVTALSDINSMWVQFQGGSGHVSDLKLAYWVGQP